MQKTEFHEHPELKVSVGDISNISSYTHISLHQERLASFSGTAAKKTVHLSANRRHLWATLHLQMLIAVHFHASLHVHRCFFGSTQNTIHATAVKSIHVPSAFMVSLHIFGAFKSCIMTVIDKKTTGILKLIVTKTYKNHTQVLTMTKIQNEIYVNFMRIVVRSIKGRALRWIIFSFFIMKSQTPAFT